KPTLPIDIYLNQPNPYRESWREIRPVFFAALALLIVLQIHFSRQRPEITASDEHFVYERATAATPPPTNPPAADLGGAQPSDPAKTLTTPHFKLAGGDQRVDIDASADVDNNWVDLDFRLVNVNTNESFPAFLELSYYHGSDEDGPWNEGSYHRS